MPNKYKQYDESEVDRDHKLNVMAVHKETGLFFGGKKNGTHIGYPKLASVKKALTAADRDTKDYYYVGLAFTPYGLPTITLLEGAPNNPLRLDDVDLNFELGGE